MPEQYKNKVESDNESNVDLINVFHISNRFVSLYLPGSICI